MTLFSRWNKTVLVIACSECSLQTYLGNWLSSHALQCSYMVYGIKWCVALHVSVRLTTVLRQVRVTNRKCLDTAHWNADSLDFKTFQHVNKAFSLANSRTEQICPCVNRDENCTRKNKYLLALQIILFICNLLLQYSNFCSQRHFVWLHKKD